MLIIDNYKTGIPKSLPATKTISNGDQFTDWYTWDDFVAAGYGSTPVGDVQTKTQYSVRSKNTKTSDSSSMPGWTLYDTQTKTTVKDWTEWNVAVPPAQANRVIQQKQEPSATATQYRYGAYVSATKSPYRTFCPCPSNANWVSDPKNMAVTYTAWTTKRYSSTGKTYTCGKHGTAFVGTDGTRWAWKRYEGVTGTDGKNNVYYWEETRTVTTAYKTLYRYQDTITTYKAYR